MARQRWQEARQNDNKRQGRKVARGKAERLQKGRQKDSKRQGRKIARGKAER